jgi:hypothetical protein
MFDRRLVLALSPHSSSPEPTVYAFVRVRKYVQITFQHLSPDTPLLQEHSPLVGC